LWFLPPGGPELNHEEHQAGTKGHKEELKIPFMKTGLHKWDHQLSPQDVFLNPNKNTTCVVDVKRL
jgi:hypothetical protein